MSATQRLTGIGLIIVVVLAIVLGVLKPNPFKDSHSYWAVFDTAHGLGAIDRDVRIGGVKIGDVGQVKRTGDDVRVEMILSEDYPLHADATADMRPHTLFEGSNYIDLAPGSPGAPLIDEGATLPRDQTTNYVTLDSALRVLRPEIRNNLRQLAEVGANTLQGEAVDGIQSTLKHFPAMAKALGPAARAAQGPHREELVHGIQGLSETVDAVARERDSLIPLMRRLNSTATALDIDGGAALDAALAELPRTLQAVNDDAPALTDVLERLSGFAGDLGTSTPRAVSRSLSALTPVLTDATPVLRAGTPVVHDARLVATRLANAEGGLTTMFEVLAEPLKTFPQTLEALNKETTLGASSGALQLVAGGFEGGAAVFSAYQTPAQNANAPGHALRATGVIDPSALGGILGVLGLGGLPVLRDGMEPAVPCADVAKVARGAAALVKENGGCR